MEENSLQSPNRKLRRKGGVQEFLNNHIGSPIDILPQNKLPTRLSILLRLRSLKMENNFGASTQTMSKKFQAPIVANEVVSIWERAAMDCIHTYKIDNIIIKLKD